MPFSNRDWRLIFVTWDAATGVLNCRTADLNGQQDSVPPQQGPAFSTGLSHLKIGPEVRAQYSDVLIYNRPLDLSEWERFYKALPDRFFNGTPPTGESPTAR